MQFKYTAWRKEEWNLFTIQSHHGP